MLEDSKDTSEGELFLSNFKGRHIFVAMRDDYSKAPVHFHREYNSVKDALFKRNSEMEEGIFFTVNELWKEKDISKKRTGKMFHRARSLYLDDDNVRTEKEGVRSDFPLVPSVVVESSEGKYHYYWLIEDSEDYSSVTGFLNL